MSESATAKPRFKKTDTASNVAAIEGFLERAALASAPAWRPEEGDILSGVILGFRMGHTDEYGDYPVIVVKSDNGPVAFHCFHGVVRERLRELQPKKGMLFTVQYGGRVESSKRTDANGEAVRYHTYYIECGDVADNAPILDEMTF